jgi:hypothetical protein
VKPDLALDSLQSLEGPTTWLATPLYQISQVTTTVFSTAFWERCAPASSNRESSLRIRHYLGFH